MKTKNFTIVILGVLALVAAFLPSQHEEHAVLAAGSAVTLMSAQTAAGPGLASVSSSVTPAESERDRFIFQYHASASGVDGCSQRRQRPPPKRAVRKPRETARMTEPNGHSSGLPFAFHDANLGLSQAVEVIN